MEQDLTTSTVSPRAKAGDRMTLPSTDLVLTAFQSVGKGLRRAGRWVLEQTMQSPRRNIGSILSKFCLSKMVRNPEWAPVGARMLRNPDFRSPHAL